jgi:hypothetical protein
VTRLPRLEFHQLWVPGTDGANVILTLHEITDRNFSQRVTIARRSPEQQRFRFHDFVATRDQLYDLVGELDERAGLLTDRTPRGDDLRDLIG